MARKAVQGYSDKTFYDNTRYLGMLATSDPLNEGYFKHLVNFDISDTGQSVTPRRGFLTTTLRHNDGYNTPIALSQDTITYKDNDLGNYIVYDFKSKSGYIVDISNYNFEDKLIPIVNAKIANYDWTDVISYVLRNDADIKQYYDSIVIGVNPGQYTTTQRTGMVLSEILSNFTDFGNDINKVYRIIDEDTVTKTLFKVKIKGVVGVTPYETPFFLSVYYRQDEVTIDDVLHPADTLVFGVVDMDYHPTYNIVERNIASGVSIIPPSMQTLYIANYDVGGIMTSTNRPDGHVNVLGPMYVKEGSKYFINYVYPNKAYDIIPYMTMDPASITINNPDAEWAYRFDIVSTKQFTSSEEELKTDTIFRGSWFNYRGKVYDPIQLFNQRNNVELSFSTAPEDRHYYDSRYIVVIVPKTPQTFPRVQINGYIPLYAEYADNQPADYTTFVGRYNEWRNLVEAYDGKKSLRKIFTTLADSALFYIYDCETNTYNGSPFNIHSVSETQNINDWILEGVGYTPSNTNDYDTYADYFKTSDDMLELFDNGFFNNEHLSFKLFPFAARCSEYVNETTYNWRYIVAELKLWSAHNAGAYDALPLMFKGINKYNSNTTFNFSAWNVGHTELTLRVNTNELQTSAGDLPGLKESGFFEGGYSIIFYMYPYLPEDLVGKSYREIETIKETWAASAYGTTRQVFFAYDNLTVTTIPEVLVKDPRAIKNANNGLVFQDNRFVLWNNNVVYISEPGEHNYFKEANRREFPEKVIKVIEYKTILLVFTVQHLYAIYSATIEVLKADEKGNIVPTPTPAFAHQCVLYNILADERYVDVIQVFNQMVLFYSADGQMFMIKPNVMIDNETQFSLQFFNKSVNDVLKNYDTYINERLANYNIDTRVTREDVQIKALISINYIKIFYIVPGLITYILVYDVINNRYTFYDTLTFTDIKDKMFVEGGEAYITVQDSKLFYTIHYLERNTPDNYADMSYVNSFKKVAISCLIDVGNLNLNNHINKRFRDLYVVFKNLSASKLLFNAETVIDDIVSHPYYDTRLEVRDINGSSYFVTVPKSNGNDLIELVDINQVSEAASNAFMYALNNNLFEENNMLMDFAGYTSSKLLTYRTSILGLGKVFRLKLQFISKGSYKIQSFGIVYKERRL